MATAEFLSNRIAELTLELATLRDQLNNVTVARTRDNAGANEVQDIANILESIRRQNPCGRAFINKFEMKFPGYELLGARERTGTNRGTHYDFDILVRHNGEEEWKHVEHKGGRDYRPIGNDETPWAAGVQFHNGGAEQYSLARKYARTWYDTYIASRVLADEFHIAAPIPTFDEWFAQDVKVQGDPKTAFGRELKQTVRAARGAKASLLDKREAVNTALEITPADIETLKIEVLEIANQALQQKDYWLTVRGDLHGEFTCAWYPKFTITSIDEVIVKKHRDIELEFRCAGGFNFGGLLRWGKGAGFSNLRLDLR